MVLLIRGPEDGIEGLGQGSPMEFKTSDGAADHSLLFSTEVICGLSSSYE
jgi:hypothetical protein